MAKKVVRTPPKSHGNPAAVTVKEIETEALKCGYCKGTGRDPWELLSPLSKCQVCKGSGTVVLPKPTITCHVCGGEGNDRNKRVTCLACGGKGAVHIEPAMEKCPKCDGTGMTGSMGLRKYCLKCKGKGLIST